MNTDHEQLLAISRLIDRLGLKTTDVDAEQPAAIQPLKCAGHTLPITFLWFCARCPSHAEWPHNGWPGIFSPFGNPSPIELRNKWRRENPLWPAHLVAFMGTDDGDYCFAYGSGDEPFVVYVDDWSNPRADEDRATVTATRVADSFEEWLRDLVEWFLEKHRNSGIP